MNDSKWKTEFEAFQNVESMNPPQSVSHAVLSNVHQALNPSPWKVFSKLSAIHLVSALFTLSVCPQFGFRVWGDGMGLMHQFMAFGEVGCAIACGSFFLGTTLLLAMMALKIEEIRALRKHRLTEIGALVLMSLGAFIMIDATDIVAGFVVGWITGSMLAAVTVLELGWKIRNLAR